MEIAIRTSMGNLVALSHQTINSLSQRHRSLAVEPPTTKLYEAYQPNSSSMDTVQKKPHVLLLEGEFIGREGEQLSQENNSFL
jgi:D-alanyl-D-alanine dipeptidase